MAYVLYKSLDSELYSSIRLDHGNNCLFSGAYEKFRITSQFTRQIQVTAAPGLRQKVMSLHRRKV